MLIYGQEYFQNIPFLIIPGLNAIIQFQTGAISPPVFTTNHVSDLLLIELQKNHE